MPTPDDFEGLETGLDSPYEKGIDVTPNDSNDLAFLPRALWIGGAGSGGLSVQWKDGTTTTFASVPVGLLRIRPARVRATGTDVTAIKALK